jgi:hypothetical protein
VNVNVAAAEVAPVNVNVTVPEAAPPVVNVAQPVINVQPRKSVEKTYTYDESGQITKAVEIEQ